MPDAVGFQVAVFDAVASVLGLTTVFLVYYASRHRPELGGMTSSMRGPMPSATWQCSSRTVRMATEPGFFNDGCVSP